ncbi:glypican-6-like [Centruroides sculpturatus]|uniref:glypican-6-like n=1 Tax=Centruroides sculpturatus TaxID=218467 RepID=UPI000C6E6DFD|nr:glypican-6-like [Centruroides sculpturatus]
MEYKLATLARIKFDQKFKKIITKLKNLFIEQTYEVDEFFRELLKTSKRDFHEMFLRTYGLIYDTNSYIFQDMFEDLERYYMTGRINLDKAMVHFFQRLYKKMFQVLNSQYQFSESYLKCIGAYMDDMKPFGDIPDKLTVEIKKSFIAIRAFVQALRIGHEVAKNMLKAELALECSKALMKMTHCSHCQGLPYLKPCGNYCLHVMKGCLTYHMEIHLSWNEYVELLLMLATRLENSFNIESVVDPIDIKISDAIMNFQENGAVVSRTLFEHCGKPKLKKRSTEENLKFKTIKLINQDNKTHTSQANKNNLDYLIQVIKKRVKQHRKFWIELPQKMCKSYRAVNYTHQRKSCWNGLEKARYEGGLNMDEIVEPKYRPEISVNMSRQDNIVNRQIIRLKLISTKMKQAFNGLDINWEDSEFELNSGGSGNRDDIIDEERDDVSDETDIAYFDFPDPVFWSTPKSIRSGTPVNRESTLLIIIFVVFFI